MLVGGKSFIRIADGSFKVRDYVIDRSVRIMLPLIASLLLFIPISYYCDIQVPLKDWIGSLFSLQGILTGCAFETLWSLSYEVWFYIIMCGFAIVLNKKTKADSLKNIIGVLLLLLGMIVFTKLNVRYLFVWIMGALALYKLPKRNGKVLIICLTLCISLMVMMQLGSGSKFIAVEWLSCKHTRTIIVLLFGLVFSVFLQHVIQYPPQNKFTNYVNKAGTKLAAFSYTLYLSHVPVLRLLERMGAPKSTSINFISIGLYMLWISLAMVVAYGLYWIFERNTALVKKLIKFLIRYK